MELTHVIKINSKVFTIVSQPKQANTVLTCPDGFTCHADIKRKKIFHRDIDGKIQVEPIIRY